MRQVVTCLHQQQACPGSMHVVGSPQSHNGTLTGPNMTHQEACEAADLLLCGSLIRQVAHKVHCTAGAGQEVATSALAMGPWQA